MEWTDDAVLRLRSLWDEGHSTAEIGRRLGVSKNAVIGKAHRLDLPGRPSPIGRPADRRRALRALRETHKKRTAMWRKKVQSLARSLGCRVAIANAMGIKLESLVDMCCRAHISLPHRKIKHSPCRQKKNSVTPTPATSTSLPVLSVLTVVRNRHTEKAPLSRQCLQCSAEFLAARLRQTYCSLRCFHDSKRKPKAVPPTVAAALRAAAATLAAEITAARAESATAPLYRNGPLS